MNFHQWETAHETAQKAFGRRAYPDYATTYAAALTRLTGNRSMPALQQRNQISHMTAEVSWIRAKRPFYRVWPKVVDMLLALDLEKVEGQMLQPLTQPVVVRLAEGADGITADGSKVRSFLVTPQPFLQDVDQNEPDQHISFDEVINHRPLTKPTYPGIHLWVDYGERTKIHGDVTAPVPAYATFPFQPNYSIASRLQIGLRRKILERGAAPTVPMQVISKCVQLYCTLCMIAEDDCDLMQRVVIRADQRKYDATGRQKFVDKAARRGIVGFDIGRGIEVVPHVRRPHPALFWTGPGRLIPVVKLRKGAIIHRDKVEALPSGHAGALS